MVLLMVAGSAPGVPPGAETAASSEAELLSDWSLDEDPGPFTGGPGPSD